MQHAQDQHVLACHMLPNSSWKYGETTDTGIVVCHLYSILQVLAETLDDGTPVRRVKFGCKMELGKGLFWKGVFLKGKYYMSVFQSVDGMIAD